jgi:hypothetical protein
MIPLRRKINEWGGDERQFRDYRILLKEQRR